MTKNYTELYKRNWPIIPIEIQQKFSRLRVGIAGCGSTGGGFIDGLLRLGIQTFHLTDNGNYELNNLNRQLVTLGDLNINKAVVHAKRIQQVNPEAIVKVWDTGLNETNVDEFTSNCDFIFDAVDVTTEAGMKMKLRLHEVACEKKIATGSALDLGYTQWLQSYNYHREERLLKGKFQKAKSCKAPLKALIVGFSPVEDLPLEISEELIRLLKDPNESACQLACACFALAGMVTPYMIHFVQTGELPKLIQLDLLKDFDTPIFREQRAAKTIEAHQILNTLLQSIA